MNAEQVVKMLDAITDGEDFVLRLDENLHISFRKGVVEFVPLDGRMMIANPRTIREIACALVAWANREDGIIFDQLTAAANLAAMRAQGIAPKERFDKKKVVELVKAVKEETMNASVYDCDEDSPMRRISRIDDRAFEILKELGEIE